MRDKLRNGRGDIDSPGPDCRCSQAIRPGPDGDGEPHVYRLDSYGLTLAG